MKPTNDELIKEYHKNFKKKNIDKNYYIILVQRLQGRLDVLEDWLDYHKGQDRVLIREIAKIKKVLK